MHDSSVLTYVYQPQLDSAFESAVRRLLERCDADFVPALSARISTHQMSFPADGVSPVPAPSAAPASSDPRAAGVTAYFAELRTQRFILALHDGEPVGFLSYIDGYRLPYLPEASAYVSTVLTEPAWRGHGIGQALYDYLERTIRPSVITLRTWSTNAAQMHILEHRGYRVIHRTQNDRGPGVDSVYFCKRTE